MRIQIKTPDQVQQMRRAGAVVAEALAAMREAARPGITTLELDAIAVEVIARNGATSNFKGYHGFPNSICASVNDVVVHGIPNTIPLHEGDVLSIDCGAIVKGWHGDAAFTIGVGEVTEEVKDLIETCALALDAGIAAMQPGKRLNDVSAAIEDAIVDRGRYGILEDYTGHGIGTAMHMDPPVYNYRVRGKGPKLVPGMCLAIEPMITLGSADTLVDPDGWTVRTVDGSVAAHWEHSIAITPAGPLILTAP